MSQTLDSIRFTYRYEPNSLGTRRKNLCASESSVLAAIRQGHMDGKSFVVLHLSPKLKPTVNNRAVHLAAPHCYPLPSLTAFYPTAIQMSV